MNGYLDFTEVSKGDLAGNPRTRDDFVPTSNACQFMAQLPETSHEGVVLDTAALLPTKTPSVGRRDIMRAIGGKTSTGRFWVALRHWTGRTQVNRIRAPAQDGRYRRMRRACVLLDRRGYGYTLGHDQRHRVYCHGNRATPILHSRRNDGRANGSAHIQTGVTREGRFCFDLLHLVDILTHDIRRIVGRAHCTLWFEDRVTFDRRMRGLLRWKIGL